jgi:hypothetical protein
VDLGSFFKTLAGASGGGMGKAWALNGAELFGRKGDTPAGRLKLIVPTNSLLGIYSVSLPTFRTFDRDKFNA